MRDPFANYDAWKTTPPEEREEFSSCCGALRDSRFETDICSECKDHCTFETDEDDDGGLYDTTRERDDDR